MLIPEPGLGARGGEGACPVEWYQSVGRIVEFARRLPCSTLIDTLERWRGLALWFP